MTLSLVVLASGRGSNFKAILHAIEGKKCDANVLALISDHADAPALSIAKEKGIPVHVVEKKDFPAALAFDQELLRLIDSHSPDLVVLAGYMRILRSPEIFSKYRRRILNIHPSLLPKYPGAHAQADAFDAGEKISGLTIHLVDETLDNGPILYQEKVDISECKSADEVSAKILAREHVAYARVIDDISKGKFPQVPFSRP
ncbi:MAG: phosphoribosylglycinamide formyltransferase [Candidatus Micrarchaeota archaeon]